ncbi:mitochondrial carrier domain-containing protein [Kickxella alabastrina]|uniref:mitochondrial carrier domain-containing protein n=1 Tax=Kickxella alabastrina TaxID=61397 RepID=UPI002220DA39|nr:mitochondrial carrier domain-containing protein [Kickxella alabastrina]KAI7834662.1 mitochondrial carrier domain-containing protein [Kickxella alabastrina]
MTGSGESTALHLVAGGVSGAVSRTVVSPLERMKILFQVRGGASASYNGVFGTLAKIWREEGMAGYMRGNGTNVVRIVPYSAVQFATYEQLKQMLIEDGKTELDTPRRLLAGAGAGIASVAATYPLDIVRTRISVQTAHALENIELLPKDARGRPIIPKMPGIVETFGKIYRTEGGLRATYRGFGATLAGVAPYIALNFQCYEVLRKFFTPPGESSPSGTRKLVCGALAGCCAQTITYPFDVLRRRMQVTSMSGIDYKYSSTFDAVRKMIKAEGVLGMYRGLVPNYLKVAPAIGVSFWSYEMAKDFLKHW